MIEVIPEVFVDRIIQAVALEDTTIFQTCKEMDEGWAEFGPGITKYKREEMGWSEAEAPRKAHAFFIESMAGKVNMHPTSMYDRKRVGTNIIARDLLQDNMSYSVCTELLRNCSSDSNGVIPIKEVQERIDWFNEETDNHSGKPPTPRDIKRYYRKNGERKEWEILWDAVVRNSKDILIAEGTPKEIMGVAKFILLRAGVDYDGIGYPDK